MKIRTAILARVVFLACCVTVPVVADEEKEPTLEEARAEFETADADLNRAYREVKTLLPDWLFDDLRAEQKEWLAGRDERALSDAVFNGGRQNEGREKESPDYWRSLTWNTRTRTQMIRGWQAKGPDGAAEIPWSGLWTDGDGGWLMIEETGDPRKVRFRISVVRGPTAHLGAISGEARRNAEAGFFTDEGDPEYHGDDDPTETWLFFEKEYGPPRLEIRGIHTQPYHGARAYFDGVYTRLRAAEEKDRELFEE
ncbi:MAG: DUF1311 domain-containing protein [Akkermansiaceae bacterium]|nr:DUF1311 domain-containing protein [Akkermansiaceae bacterium]